MLITQPMIGPIGLGWYHPKPLGPIISRVISTFKFGSCSFDLEGLLSKVKSRIATPKDAYSSMIGPIGLGWYHPKPLGPIISELISTFNFGYPHLTLKEGSFKVKSRIATLKSAYNPAHDWSYRFAMVPSQTSRTNNKRAYKHF